MDYGADVGLVDAHAEGDGGDDYVQLAGEEGALDAVAGRGVEAGVVGGGREMLVQLGGELFGVFAGRRVDDGGSRGGIFQDVEGEVGALRLGELDDLDGEVVAAKAGDEDGGILQVELGGDVALDGGRCGRGEGDDGRGAEGWEILAEGAVVGAEVVAPGADAVGFVDGDEGGFALGEHLGEAGDAHALGGDEEEVEGAVEVVAAGLAGVFAGEAGVDAGDAEAEGGELGGLVVHEGDERADDQRGAAAGDGGELVAEGLAGSGGHDEQDVAAVGGGVADGFLVGAEVAVAEDAVEELGEGLGWLERGH